MTCAISRRKSTPEEPEKVQEKAIDYDPEGSKINHSCRSANLLQAAQRNLTILNLLELGLFRL
jgi:hypothetical protein